MISSGNANQVVVLPPMDTIIGDADQANVIAGGFDGSLRADGSIRTEIQVIIGATNELGFHTLTAKAV